MPACQMLLVPRQIAADAYRVDALLCHKCLLKPSVLSQQQHPAAAALQAQIQCVFIPVEHDI